MAKGYKIDIKKLHDRFNKKWIGSLYGIAIFMIFCSLGGIIGFAFGESLIYLFLWLLVIGYAIVLPIGCINEYIKKNYIKGDWD